MTIISRKHTCRGFRHLHRKKGFLDQRQYRQIAPCGHPCASTRRTSSLRPVFPHLWPGLAPEYYARMVIPVEVGQKWPLEALIARLCEVHYERNDYDFHRGTFRVRGDALEIIPAYHHERALRIEFLGTILIPCAKLIPYRRSCFRNCQDCHLSGQPLCVRPGQSAPGGQRYSG